MEAARRGHDMSDKVWELLDPHPPSREGTRGVTARDNRNFLNAVFWFLRQGAPWLDLAPDYVAWKNTHCRFCRWRDSGVWQKLLEILISEPDFE